MRTTDDFQLCYDKRMLGYEILVGLHYNRNKSMRNYTAILLRSLEEEYGIATTVSDFVPTKQDLNTVKEFNAGAEEDTPPRFPICQELCVTPDDYRALTHAPMPSCEEMVEVAVQDAADGKDEAHAAQVSAADLQAKQLKVCKVAYDRFGIRMPLDLAFLRILWSVEEEDWPHLHARYRRYRQCWTSGADVNKARLLARAADLVSAESNTFALHNKLPLESSRKVIWGQLFLSYMLPDGGLEGLYAGSRTVSMSNDTFRVRAREFIEHLDRKPALFAPFVQTFQVAFASRKWRSCKDLLEGHSDTNTAAPTGGAAAVGADPGVNAAAAQPKPKKTNPKKAQTLVCKQVLMEAFGVELKTLSNGKRKELSAATWAKLDAYQPTRA